ncbi:MAG: transcription antitermination factor NusB [bacterium]|nr:transcription antitermination factor NusB [bacterium]
MTSRRKTRELALSAMYEAEVGHHEIEAVLERTIEKMVVEEPASDFLMKSVRLAWENKAEVDKIVEELAIGWKLDRIARIDLVILRLAIVELLLGVEDPPIPDPIVINEAVVLTKKFSTEDSGKFINGILASVIKEKEKYTEILKAGETIRDI